MITLYNVISTDGFIARNDGREDFISDSLWPNFLNLCNEYGSIIMGRKTYETIQKYDKKLLESFEKLPIKKIVISKNLSFHPKKEYILVDSPEKSIALAPNGLVSSGPTLNNFLLENHLVKKVIFHKVPVSIGDGIKPFDEKMISFISEKNIPKIEGVEVSEYNVV